MKPIIIDLEHPIEANGEQLAKLTIGRRPTVADLKAMDGQKGEVAKTSALLAKLAGVPPSSIDQMDAGDFMRAGEVVEGFLS